MLRKSILSSVVATVFLLMFTQMAVAYQVRTFASSWGVYQTGSGGEFTLEADGNMQSVLSGYVSGTTSNLSSSGGYEQGTFQTFCLEYDEYIYQNTTYNVTLNTEALRGGANTNNGDPISVGTALLYRSFVSGNWDWTGMTDAYDYSGARLADAAALQEAFWYLEDEIKLDDPTQNFYLDLLLSVDYGYFVSESEAKTNSNGKYGILVANLYDAKTGEYRQDMLVASTPIPAAVWLLASGLLGITAIRRRKSSGLSNR